MILALAPERRDGLPFWGAGLRRGIAFILAFVLLLSGLPHFAVGGHDVSSPGHVHELVWLDDDPATEPCCPRHNGQPHASNCGMASDCSLCGLVIGAAAAIPPLEARSKKVQPDDVRIGRAPSPQLRPPTLSLNA